MKVSPSGRIFYTFQLRMTSRADRLAHQQQREEGIGTNKRAVKFSGQDYETLRKECLRSGSLFEDNCFPAGSRSLGYEELGPHSAKTRGLVWKRPKVKNQLRKYPHPSHSFCLKHTQRVRENMRRKRCVSCLTGVKCLFVVIDTLLRMVLFAGAVPRPKVH